jgi:hypothetical protein
LELLKISFVLYYMVGFIFYFYDLSFPSDYAPACGGWDPFELLLLRTMS